MNDIDKALSELGMLSQRTNYKEEYEKEMKEKSLEPNNDNNSLNNLKNDISGDRRNVKITINDNFVTSIAIKDTNKTASMGQQRLEREIEDKRLSNNYNHCCGQHHSPSTNHICYFVSPPRRSCLHVSRHVPSRLHVPSRPSKLSRSRRPACTSCVIDSYGVRLANRLTAPYNRLTAPYFKPFRAHNSGPSCESVTSELEERMREIKLDWGQSSSVEQSGEKVLTSSQKVDQFISSSGNLEKLSISSGGESVSPALGCSISSFADLPMEEILRIMKKPLGGLGSTAAHCTPHPLELSAGVDSVSQGSLSSSISRLDIDEPTREASLEEGKTNSYWS